MAAKRARLTQPGDSSGSEPYRVQLAHLKPASKPETRNRQTKTPSIPCEEAVMKQSLLVLGTFLLAGLGISFAQPNATQENSNKSNEEYKITPADIARTNPVKSTPEGLAEARRAFGYDCEMCHGAQGDGKGEVVESMKLTMHDWRDPASLAGKTDGELFYIITKGKGKMMGEGDRQPEKLRWNLVNLVRSIAAKAAPQKSTPPTPSNS